MVRIELSPLMAASAPAYSPAVRVAQNITPGGSSQASAIEAQSNEYATVIAKDQDVYVAFGPAPVASAANGRLVQAETIRDFGPLRPGDKIAVVSA